MKLVAFLLAASMLAVSPPAAAKPKRPAAAADAQLAESVEALQALDTELLMQDSDYAEAMLIHADRLETKAGSPPEIRQALAATRIMALSSLKRHREALQAGQSAIAAGPTGAAVLGLTILSSIDANEPKAALALLEHARTLPAAEQEELRRGIDEKVVSWLAQHLQSNKDRPSLHRLAEALLALGWPEQDDFAVRDYYRSVAAEGRIAAGDVTGARAVVGEIANPEFLGGLLVAKKYDALFPESVNRPQMLQQSLDRYDRLTLQRLKAAPDDPKRLRERGNALRAQGREAEAAALLLPFAMDLAKVENAGADGFWLVNEAAYALSASGRGDEAVGLMDKLLTLGMDKHPDLISMAINKGELLNDAGRYKEAAAHEAMLSQMKDMASPYGFMWMWSIAACAHALSGDQAGAAPWLEKLRKNSADNEAAHMRALLCANDLDAAEALLIARLKGDDRQSVLLKLQDYRQGSLLSAISKVLEPRLLAVRERPAVKEAISGAGRIISLPLSRTYWGDY
jgi:tetratricopeptide (TPR) repeat protein